MADSTQSARRVWAEANFTVETGSTVRTTAQKFGLSKSTIHHDITTVLMKVDSELYKKVREILDVNKAERHMRGGMATKEKYAKKS